MSRRILLAAVAAVFVLSTAALAQEADQETVEYEDGTVLVASTGEDHPWAKHQIAGALPGEAIPFDGTIDDAFALARENDSVDGLVELNIDVDSAIESVRAVCFAADGSRVWQKKSSMSWFGSQEQMARRMVRKVAKKIDGMGCP